MFQPFTPPPPTWPMTLYQAAYYNVLSNLHSSPDCLVCNPRLLTVSPCIISFLIMNFATFWPFLLSCPFEFTSTTFLLDPLILTWTLSSGYLLDLVYFQFILSWVRYIDDATIHLWFKKMQWVFLWTKQCIFRTSVYNDTLNNIYTIFRFYVCYWWWPFHHWPSC